VLGRIQPCLRNHAESLPHGYARCNTGSRRARAHSRSR
jgi:hypothetical protein